MTKDPLVFIEHIWECIELIETYIQQKTLDLFHKTTQLQDAVIHRLEIIGEAVKNIPEDFKAENPEIPWKDIARTRDKLIHGYFGIDLDLVWEITQKDIKDLKENISRLRRL
ncbi:MAG: DUF86 domain-containing protein [Candidatus Heimdallarchaeota archaeon]